jgi:hypothetical protein
VIDINDLIGAPYQLGGRSLSGIDCWGLVIEVYSRLGRQVPDFLSGNLSRPGLVRLMRAKHEEVAFEVPVPSQWDIAADIAKAHVGLWLSGRVLHADRKMGVKIDPWGLFQSQYPATRFFRCR